MTPHKCEDCGIQTLPPGHVAVPVADMNELRTLLSGWNCTYGNPLLLEIRQCVYAILSYLPPRTDHVARLRELMEYTGKPGLFVGDPACRAALEAAIKLMEAQR